MKKYNLLIVSLIILLLTENLKAFLTECVLSFFPPPTKSSFTKKKHLHFLQVLNLTAYSQSGSKGALPHCLHYLYPKILL